MNILFFYSLTYLPGLTTTNKQIMKFMERYKVTLHWIHHFTYESLTCDWLIGERAWQLKGGNHLAVLDCW